MVLVKKTIAWAGLLTGCLILFSAFAPAYGAEVEATFAGGCFWCMEHPFNELEGVTATTVGYMGGHVEAPSYRQVASGKTGHAEVIQVTYDPEIVSYDRLLEVFWRNVDPVDAEGQFCDRGSQYRTAIFTYDEPQQQLATDSKAEVSDLLSQPIATEIVAASQFFPAEEYHQDYADKNPLLYRYYRFSCGRDRRLREVWGAIE
ncbi:peptide-methionine (S)-S-oxide reductase MsrA [Synechococcus sp. PCC 7336]|uniref:peptide-methionine (S)-S-oxide reductase MsrA n=1 Tax=Synechococcus sp. PCC 7336 TaxID=195250 RepID=UPI001930E091